MQSYLQSYAPNLLSIILLYTIHFYEIVQYSQISFKNIKNDLSVSKNSIYKNNHRFDQNRKKNVKVGYKTRHFEAIITSQVYL